MAFPVSLPQTVLTPATTNFVFTQPQQLSAGQQSQPQLLMAGSSASQTAGLPIQQILVPINQQQINSNTGESMIIYLQGIATPTPALY